MSVRLQSILRLLHGYLKRNKVNYIRVESLNINIENIYKTRSVLIELQPVLHHKQQK